jgi:hypothetical protein
MGGQAWLAPSRGMMDHRVLAFSILILLGPCGFQLDGRAVAGSADSVGERERAKSPESAQVVEVSQMEL